MESLIFFGKTIAVIIPFVLYIWAWISAIAYLCERFYRFAFLIFMLCIGLFLSTSITIAHFIGS